MLWLLSYLLILCVRWLIGSRTLRSFLERITTGSAKDDLNRGLQKEVGARIAPSLPLSPQILLRWTINKDGNMFMTKNLLRAIVLFALASWALALDTGYYRIQNVALSKNVEARQEGLPLFVVKNETLFVHEAHEQDYTVWHVEKRFRGGNTPPIYTLHHNATKMYAQVYHLAFNTTLVITEKVATQLNLQFLGDHEWTISLPGSGPKRIWTIEEPFDQVTVDMARIIRKGVPRASQRFRFLPVRG